MADHMETAPTAKKQKRSHEDDSERKSKKRKEKDSDNEKSTETKEERRARKAEKKLRKLAKKAEKEEQANGTNGDVVKAASTDTLSKSTIGHSQTQATSIPPSQGYTENEKLASIDSSKVDAYLTEQSISVEEGGSATPLRPIFEFEYLPDSELARKKPFKAFKEPTPIQAASWPYLLSGRDVVGVAETGSGKTMAFAYPCIQHILSQPGGKGKKVKAVMVSPTRELALQIAEQCETLAKQMDLRVVCVYGGVDKKAQIQLLRTANIVVATPGRLNDLINDGAADLSSATYLVLDEADRMLDKGFEDDLRRIVQHVAPKLQRQTVMFTATWPPSIRELAATFMRNPVRINIGDNPTGELKANTRISQTVHVVDPRGKEDRLLEILRTFWKGNQNKDRVLVFCLYKKEATRVEQFLRWKGLKVAAIHGDMNQSQRLASLESFKSGGVPLLVATDVAARGLDIPSVKLVVNVTFPLTVEDYVHRIGRTGRAGKTGEAITLFTEHDKDRSGALINVLKAANQPVPEALLKFGTTVKRKTHDAYGAFVKDIAGAKQPQKIKFD